MRAKNTNKLRHFSSLLNEHWKRKQRLKISKRRKNVELLGKKESTKEVTRRTRTKGRMIDSFGAQVSGGRKKRGEIKKCVKKTKLAGAKATFTLLAKVSVSILILHLLLVRRAKCQQTLLQTDPRPTIYSGQVSFGLLLSAHSSLGAELSTSASYQVNSVLANSRHSTDEESPTEGGTWTSQAATTTTTLTPAMIISANNSSNSLPAPSSEHQVTPKALNVTTTDSIWFGQPRTTEAQETMVSLSSSTKTRKNRQIFERTGGGGAGRRQYQRQPEKSAASLAQEAAQAAAAAAAASVCSQTNPNALYAGMGAIWASHQANLVGDTHLAIGTYVYDSCNDLDVGQRQSVRIVSNLNAFQQTTCESPRGAPISLTIAHGDNQLRAIQLLSSFKVPVITTKEHFDLEDYSQLSPEQKRYLFTTAPSSRHLAVGALRFARRIVQRSTSSPKLPNHFYKMSSKNGLIVISQNLPARFISYLVETIPTHVNYEMLQSFQPIDQIKSFEVLEKILIKSGSSLSSESRISNRLLEPPSGGGGQQQQQRNKRSSSEDSDSSSGDSEYESTDADGKMLSPTILMFITPSEAIDLVTRLRNDLAEVSRHYSLIVSTREDISPALKTIFHRGGSRLCSGKAFYTISPKPDDISEFSRYFRDTVQMEGETSDHPLICEFSKYQTDTRMQADLDEISTEPVIKAVWAAASAFKYVYNQQCGSINGSSTRGGGSGSTPSSSSSNGQLLSNLYRAGGNSGAPDSEPSGEGVNTGRVMASGRRSDSAANKQQAHSDCMIRMNKNMAQYVQRALKRLDTAINSTGLQSLDGFKIKFDQQNELMTNKFSIKYINKECEITEMGVYSGLNDSKLRIEEDALLKSLESTLPDPWPARKLPPPTPPTAKPAPPPTAPATMNAVTSTEPSSSSGSAGNEGGGSNGKESSGANEGVDGGSSEPAESPAASTQRGRRKSSSGGSDSSSADSDNKTRGSADTEEDEPNGQESSETEEPPKTRTSKRSRISEAASNERVSRHRVESNTNKKRNRKKNKERLTAAPVTAMSGGRGIMPGLTDTEVGGNEGGASDRAASASKLVGSENARGDFSGSSEGPRPMRKLNPFPSNTFGVTLKDWLPQGGATVGSTSPAASAAVTVGGSTSGSLSTKESTMQPTRVPALSSRLHDDEQVDPAAGPMATNNDLKARGTTQAPVYSTLPESGGNADLDLPPSTSRTSPPTSTTSLPAGHSRVTKSTPDQTTTGSSKAGKAVKSRLDTAESMDYVTSPSISKNSFDRHFLHSTSSSVGPGILQTAPNRPLSFNYDPLSNGSSLSANSRSIVEQSDTDSNRVNYFKDLNIAPIPLSANSQNNRHSSSSDQHSSSSSDGRPTLRSQLRWIYSSWFGLAILGANICGALMTLYVLTFLLMKNCDGSLDRENQGMRSMHLLAIIVVFFGSTLFIVYPTPGLCLLRTSWHNFSLVLLFGSLLLQAMQTRSLTSLGLGGRPNRLNQFLTLLFMVGVQVAFELQRWKYESANYVNFVSHYFGSSSETNQKVLLLTSAIGNQFNPLNAFNDQVTPVSIQVSEQYQNLLQDYCMQKGEDFLSSQIYLCIIVGLLVIFSTWTRKSGRLTGDHHKLTTSSSSITSGKLVASAHEANLNLTPSHHFQSFGGAAFGGATNPMANGLDTGNMFLVTIISAPIYSISIILHIYGQNNNGANGDLISSVTMIIIAFVALLGIFLPLLVQIHRFNSLVVDRLPGSLTRPSAVMAAQSLKAQHHQLNFGHHHHHHHLQHHNLADHSPSTAFTLFPEFAPTGLRRPSSASGDSSSGQLVSSRRPFAETKESRRKMGAALANLGPSADSLRSMRFYATQAGSGLDSKEQQDSCEVPMILQTAAGEHSARSSADCSTSSEQFALQQQQQQQESASGNTINNYKQPKRRQQQLYQQQQNPDATTSRRKKEKRLIMLDVDPCCPRHGIGANTSGASRRQSAGCGALQQDVTELETNSASKMIPTGGKSNRTLH